MLDSDGTLSFDVLGWLARQRIPLVLLDWQGEVLTTFSDDGVAADQALRQAQVAALTNGVGLRLATQLVRDKVRGCQETLCTLPPAPTRDAALHKLDAAHDELVRVPPGSVEALRLVEARAALAYFACWHAHPLRWTGTARKPVPEAWHRVGPRQSSLSGTNRRATHPLNAMLNYAYGVLESQVRAACAVAGLDPAIGYLHACRAGRPALVYDLMEPLRPAADRAILALIRARTLTPGDVTLTPEGACRLHPQLARAVAGLALGDNLVRATVDSASTCILPTLAI